MGNIESKPDENCYDSTDLAIQITVPFSSLHIPNNIKIALDKKKIPEKQYL